MLGYDDPSLWFNALPPFINNKSYYEMLYDDAMGGEPAPHAEGPNNIFKSEKKPLPVSTAKAGSA